MDINKRIKELRQALGLSQPAFAQRISISNGYIAAIELGNRRLNDRIIKLVCSEFNVSERWLRTGEGEMFEQLTRNQKIAQEVNRVLRAKPESFRSRFIAALCRLDESDWEVLEKIALEMAYPDEQPEQRMLHIAARGGGDIYVPETTEESESRRAETLRDLEEMKDFTFPDDE